LDLAAKLPENQIFFNNLFHFTAMLRKAGLSISLDQSMDFMRALELVDISRREQVYFSARGLLVKRREDFAVFDRVFELFWRSSQKEVQFKVQKTPLAPRHNFQKRELSLATLLAQRAQQTDPEVDIADKSQSFSPDEVLRTKDFSVMSPEELASIKKLMESITWQVSQRSTRRRIPNRHGKYFNMRAILRHATRYNGVPLDLSWLRRKIKARPLIVLADISGSMEKYSRILLQFCYGLTHRLQNVECFVFATRLSRVTLQLRTKNINRALDEAAAKVFDWSGGTHIGQSLYNFNRQWSKRVLRRGAVVLIISDGWEREDTSNMIGNEMRYLQHRCHRLIWLNPLLGNDKYQPLVAGMVAALPYIDDFLPIHNLQSLEALGRHLAILDRRRNLKPVVISSK
jgi:uncharacterized protein with von Willebrand factor type A (vWA) domain